MHTNLHSPFSRTHLHFPCDCCWRVYISFSMYKTKTHKIFQNLVTQINLSYPVKWNVSLPPPKGFSCFPFQCQGTERLKLNGTLLSRNKAYGYYLFLLLQPFIFILNGMVTRLLLEPTLNSFRKQTTNLK